MPSAFLLSVDYHVDAVICGNGGCGICTPKETGSAIAAEYLGIPAVVVAGPGFTDQAKYTAYNNGVAVLRTAEYPGAFATHTEQQLIDNTRNVTWPQILAGLTTPITQAEIDAAKNADHGDLRDDVFWGDIHKIDSFFVSANGSPVSFNGREIVNSEHKKIAIYDASGKMVGRSNTHFSMRSLPSGVYMVYVAGYKGVACKVVKN